MRILKVGWWEWRGRDKELISRIVFLRSVHRFLIRNKSEGVGGGKKEDEKTVWPLFHLGLEGSLVELAEMVIWNHRGSGCIQGMHTHIKTIPCLHTLLSN